MMEVFLLEIGWELQVKSKCKSNSIKNRMVSNSSLNFTNIILCKHMCCTDDNQKNTEDVAEKEHELLHGRQKIKQTVIPSSFQADKAESHRYLSTGYGSVIILCLMGNFGAVRNGWRCSLLWKELAASRMTIVVYDT